MDRMTRKTAGRRMALGGLLMMALQGVSSAHHMEGGKLPETLGEGLLSGLAHPVIGLDHLAFLLAVGLLSLRWSRGALMPFLILPGALLGTAVHLQGKNLLAAEVWIALSVILFGLLLALSRRLPLAAAAALAGLFGIAHGYAFGESIIGAHQNVVGAYLAGFTLVQLGIVLAVRGIAIRLAKGIAARPAPSPALRMAGLLLGAVGLAHLLNGFRG